MVTRPAPARRAPRAASRAAPVCDWSPDTTTRVTAPVFVPAGLRHRKALRPERLGIGEYAGTDALQHGVGNADVDNLDRAGMEPPRQQQMARFSPKERHRFAGGDRSPHHRAAVAVDATRQIDGDHRDAGGVDRLDHRPRRRLDRPVETGAKQRVDNQAGP